MAESHVLGAQPRPGMSAARIPALLFGLFSIATCWADTEFGGEIRPSSILQRAADHGPLASAAALLPSIEGQSARSQEVQAELRARLSMFSGTATLDARRRKGVSTRLTGWFNELYWADGAGAWQLTAGRRIVSWDVGYGFRPNDVVQQEARRLLVPSTPVGRDVLMAERFDASTAWAVVLVNPGASRERQGPQEPALAVRYYRHEGPVDWHAIARYGARTRGSVGGAAAWVVNDSTELHGSLRYLEFADSRAMDTSGPIVAPSTPWRQTVVHGAVQALAGGTWTGAQQLSVLAEIWWDGTALTEGQWNGWNSRNRQLIAFAASPVPATALGANLAWQTDAFGAASNLRRFNAYTRANWKFRAWEPAVDALYTPSDGGRMWTVSVGWQGDSVRLEGGARYFGGRQDSVLAQTPVRRVLYAYGSWRF